MSNGMGISIAFSMGTVSESTTLPVKDALPPKVMSSFLDVSVGERVMLSAKNVE
jgi:hypothetical protein